MRIFRKISNRSHHDTTGEFNRIAAELSYRTCLTTMPLENSPLDDRVLDQRSGYSLGFACNLANNAYIMVKGLQRRGVDCKLFIEPDFTDSSQLAHPAWEDQWFVGKDMPPISDIERDWRKPDYCIENRYRQEHSCFSAEFDYAAMNSRMVNTGITTNDPVSYLKHLQIISHLEMLERFNTVDVLHVSGPMIGLASFSPKPYVTFPFGGDLYITPFEDNLRGWFQVQGFRRAEMHIASGQLMLDYLIRLGVSRNKIALLPFMYDTDEYAPSADNPLRARLRGEYPGRKIFFIGARQNWIWKGNDKLYRAIARIKDISEKAVFITTWWGQDTESSDRLIADLGIADVIVKIGVASKGALKQYIDAADVCIDQFNIGSLGTFSLESLSFAKPLVVYFENDKHFDFAEDPPLLNAGTEDQIFDVLNEVICDSVDLHDLGARSRSWMQKYHSMEALWPEYDQVYRAALAHHNSRR